jgi:hypothetical protein
MYQNSGVDHMPTVIVSRLSKTTREEMQVSPDPRHFARPSTTENQSSLRWRMEQIWVFQALLALEWELR